MNRLRNKITEVKRDLKQKIKKAKAHEKSYDSTTLNKMSISRRKEILGKSQKLKKELDERINGIEIELKELEIIEVEDYVSRLNQDMMSKLVNLRLSNNVLQDLTTQVDDESVESNVYSEIEADD
jgi:hypothetical protein